MAAYDVVFGLVGAGGFGREVMPIAAMALAKLDSRQTSRNVRLCFVEESPTCAQINGHAVMALSDFLATDCEERFFNVAIGDSKARERLSIVLSAAGAVPFSIQAPNCTVYDNNEIGEGAILCANSIVTSNARMGRFFHANLGAYVAHDCIVGDFVTFAPNVHCNGNVHVHDHAYVGTGAIIKQGTLEKPIVIGEGAIVGMGAVVTKSVPPFTTVVGNPAKPLAP